MAKFIIEIEIPQGVTPQEIIDELNQIIAGKKTSKFQEDDFTILYEDDAVEDEGPISVTEEDQDI